MNLIFYPDLDKNTNKNRLWNYIYDELRRISLKKWRPMYHFLNIIMNKDRRHISDLIQKESLKPQKSREVAKLKDGLFEYRGKQAKNGTIRVYFFIIGENIYIVDAEMKTGDDNKIERATQRMKSLKERLKDENNIR